MKYILMRNEWIYMKHRLSPIFRRGFALLVIVSILASSAFAAGDTVYTINWAGIQVSLPSDYIIVTSGDTAGGDSNDQTTTEDFYLYGTWTDAQGNTDFTIQSYDLGDTGVEFSTCSQEELDAEFAYIDGYFRENFTVTQSLVQTMGSTRFFRLVYSDAEGYYFVSYITGHYGELTTLEAVGHKGYVSQEALTILDNMVYSLVLTDGSVSAGAPTDGLVPVEPAAPAADGSDGIAIIDSPQQVYVDGIASTGDVPTQAQNPPPVEEGSYDYSSDPSGDSGRTEDNDSGGIGTGGIIGIGVGILVLIWLVASSKSKKADKEVKEALKRAEAMKAGTSYSAHSSEPVYHAPTSSAGSAGFCTACGSELKPGAAFCGKCGKKVS